MDVEQLVNVENVSRFYNAVCAVNDISFTMQRGEVLGLLGPNGAGKSTTMKMICGVLAPDSGRIAVAGHALETGTMQARGQIGYLPEQPPLYPDLTVDEYLVFCARLHHLRGKRLRDALADSKARCGLEDSGRRLIANLSRGFQQRVGIAQAILHAPAVVILDEPTSGLDPNQIVEIRLLIKELGEDHSVILSSHILQEVQSTCSRVLILNDGRLVLDTRMTEIETGQDSGTFIIAFDNPPLPEDLEALPAVAAVSVLDKHRFRISGHDPESARVLAGIAAERGWGLYELIPEHNSLENIFMQLTQQDAGTGLQP